MKKLFMVLPLVLLLCFTFGCQKGEEVAEEVAQEKRLPIIDVHVHAESAWKREKPDWFPENVSYPKTDEELMRETLKSFERFNIVKAVVFGSALEKWIEAAPERIIPGFPTGIAGSKPGELEFLRGEFEAGRLEMLGEIVSQYLGIAPNDSLCEPYFAMAEELEVPVGIHMGLGPPGNVSEYRMKLSNPLLLEDVLIRHPKLRIYVMHAGWPFLDEMIGLLHSYPQVYVDVSLINWFIPRKEFHTYLRRLIEAGFEKRIMFGSDHWVWLGVIELGIEGIESADFLTEEQKRDIFYNNAVRFFRLEVETQ